jgi:hypothetical protein
MKKVVMFGVGKLGQDCAEIKAEMALIIVSCNVTSYIGHHDYRSKKRRLQ